MYCVLHLGFPLIVLIGKREPCKFPSNDTTTEKVRLERRHSDIESANSVLLALLPNQRKRLY